MEEIQAMEKGDLYVEDVAVGIEIKMNCCLLMMWRMYYSGGLRWEIFWYNKPKTLDRHLM